MEQSNKQTKFKNMRDKHAFCENPLEGLILNHVQLFMYTLVLKKVFYRRFSEKSCATVLL